MKILHLADCHLDAPFIELGQTANKANMRRHELKETFSRAIDLAILKEVDLLLISGDLFEQKYVEKSTIRFINDKFNRIPHIKVFITPGNHDPIVQNSYYNTYEWAPNVHIFGGDFEKVYISELNTNIWGVGFNDFYLDKCLVGEIERSHDDTINILLTHGTLDIDSNTNKYHPLPRYISAMGFDYCALGHIHKSMIDKARGVYYPGSPEPLGFDEPGKHGVILGEVTKEHTNIEFYPLGYREYFVKDIDVSGALTSEDVIDDIRILVNSENTKDNFYKINLTGKLEDFSVDTVFLEDCFRDRFHYIKIEDKTQGAYLLEQLEKEYTLKGLFAKRMNELIKKANPEDKDMLTKALHYGLDVLTKGEVKL